MNAPIENAATPPNHELARMPELSRTQSNFDDVALHRRKSVRTRPAEHLERQKTGSRAPLRDPAKPPELRSKMSLFNLFSKPKVERLRGYAEQGLTTTRSNIDLRGAAKSEASAKKLVPGKESLQSRPATSKSVSARTSRMALRDQPPPMPAEDGKSTQFDILPLFQAWPQAIKHGVLEVSTIAPEMLSPKPQTLRSAALHTTKLEGSSRSSAEDETSTDTKTGARMPMKHSSKSSNAGIELPKKLFILSTSSCLLQYAENGASDRVPERILRLGTNSAAFACDLIPGKHHVLEILQNVDEVRTHTNTTGSILSKFGIRTAARRQTTNFLLVMPDADEMAAWMSAVRKQIEVQGGKRARSDSVTQRPKTGVHESIKIDLKKTPSQSHRYQVKRDPSKVSLVTTPATEISEYSFEPSMSTNKVLADEEHESVKSARPGEIIVAKANDDTSQPRPRADSESPSITSADTASVEQEQLDQLRESTRMSHTSATNTLATSRTNSLTSSPPIAMTVAKPENPLRESGTSRPPARTLSSYSSANRRSLLPSPKELPQARDTRKPAPLLLQSRSAVDVPIDSPVLGHASIAHGTSPNGRLTIMQSAPDLRCIRENSDTQDFQMLPPLLSTTDDDRPASILTDLPPPSTWSSKTSPLLRMSVIQATSTQTTFTAPLTHPPPTHRMSRQLGPNQQKRVSAQSFSLPLKINPSDASPVTSSPRSPTSEEQDAEIKLHVATMHTSSTQDNPVTQKTMSPPHIPMRESSAAFSSTDSLGPLPKRNISARLSLFPSPFPAPPTHNDVLRRSPSASALTTLAQQQSASPSQSNASSLRRPTSLQIRSDHTPFLSSRRQSTQQTPPMQHSPGGVRPGMPVPIRSLKPSRSMSTIPQSAPTTSLPSTQPGRRESLLTLYPLRPLLESTPTSFDSKTFAQAQEVTGLEKSVQQAEEDLPQTRRTPSRRTSSRTFPHASLPELDLGISIVALGPPAPPPSAPLPRIPGSTSTPSPGPLGTASLECPSNAPRSPPRLPLTGLGIQVGGS